MSVDRDMEHVCKRNDVPDRIVAPPSTLRRSCSQRGAAVNCAFSDGELRHFCRCGAQSFALLRGAGWESGVLGGSGYSKCSSR